jgi:hypothetical protein
MPERPDISRDWTRFTLEVPRSLTGMGDADAAMTVDGQTANLVRIHIQ